jgi:hypothetical protein
VVVVDGAKVGWVVAVVAVVAVVVVVGATDAAAVGVVDEGVIGGGAGDVIRCAARRALLERTRT